MSDHTPPDRKPDADAADQGKATGYPTSDREDTEKTADDQTEGARKR